MTIETVSWWVLFAAIFVVGCYLWSTHEDSIEELELRAAKSIAGTKDSYLLATSTEERHFALHAEYTIFSQKNNINYEDYLLLVITYGTLALN